MKLIKRGRGILSDNPNLEKVFTYENFPVFFGCTDQNKEEDIHADMNWSIDPLTGIIQLTDLVPLEILYQDSHVDGIGEVWTNYYDNLADYISLREPKNVLELGGGNGKLASAVVEKSNTLEKWFVVDANPTCEETDKIKTLRQIIDDTFKFDVKIDMIVFSQLMEHIYDPEDFIYMLQKIMDMGAKLVFAYPDLKSSIEANYTSALNFEHTMFFTDVHLDYLLEKYGFIIHDKINYTKHSFFYDTEKASNEVLNNVLIPNKYEEFKALYSKFLDYHLHLIRDLNERIENYDKPIYLFGAHIFSQYLLSMGLNMEKIVTILDNSKTKEGKRLYGTSFISESPKILKDVGEAAVILKAGFYDNEIKKDILENINSQIIFW